MIKPMMMDLVQCLVECLAQQIDFLQESIFAAMPVRLSVRQLMNAKQDHCR